MNESPSPDPPNEDAVGKAAFGLLMGDGALDDSLVGTDAATVFTAPPVRRTAADQSVEQPGDSIGPYTLLNQLGAGGFGVVWRAEQKQPIHREVALKLVKPGMDSREIIARFAAERQALALMDHPNIAAVLDAGTTAGGRPYFAMELVKGVPLTDYCNENKLTIRERLELFIPVCQAVQHAHQKAILHRDLKPSNILVMEVDGRPVPKVIDFGIAKALGTSPEEVFKSSLVQTQAGLVIGTPQYMSPEQAGSVPDVDTRSDIYTLGVILYELLTGRTPLRYEEIKQAALDEVLRLIREGDARRPSSCFTPVTQATTTLANERHSDSLRLSRLLRGDLDWIVLKALEKERARRYDSANDLAADILRHLNDEPVSASPPSAAYRLRKLMKKHRVAFSAAAAVVLALIVGVGVAWHGQVQALRSARSAEHARNSAETLLDSMLFDLRKTLVGLGRTDVMAKLAESAKGYYAGLDDTQRNTDTERRLSGALLMKGDALFASGHTDEASPLYHAVLTRMEKQAGAHPGDVALAHNRLGDLMFHTKEYDESLKHYDAALHIREDLLGKNPSDPMLTQRLAAVLSRIAHVLTTTGKVKEGVPFLMRAIALTPGLAQMVAGSSPGSLPDVNLSMDEEEVWSDPSMPYYRLATALGGLSMAEQALEMEQKALAIREELLRQDPGSALRRREVAWSLLRVADRVGKKGETATSHDHLKRARSLFEGLCSLDPSNLVWQKDFAYCVKHQAAEAWSDGDKDKAVSMARQAVDIWQSASSQDTENPSLLIDYRTMISEYLDYLGKSGHEKEARAFVKQLIQDDDNSPRATTLKVGLAKRRLWQLTDACKSNKIDVAKAIWQECQPMIAAVLAHKGMVSEPEALNAPEFNGIPTMLREVGLFQEAFDANELRLKMMENIFALTPPDKTARLNVVAILATQARLQAELKQFPEAAKSWARTEEELERSGGFTGALDYQVKSIWEAWRQYHLRRFEAGDMDPAITGLADAVKSLDRMREQLASDSKGADLLAIAQDNVCYVVDKAASVAIGKPDVFIPKLHEVYVPLLEEWLKQRGQSEAIKNSLGNLLRITADIRANKAPDEALALRRRAITLLKDAVHYDDKKYVGPLIALGSASASAASQLKAMPDPPMKELRELLDISGKCFQALLDAGRTDGWIKERHAGVQKMKSELPAP